MNRALACLGLCLGLAGCASTRVETSGPADRPLCRAGASALVVWEPKWRPDQEDAAEREAANDPRPSLAERYGDKAAFISKVRNEAKELQRRGFYLEEDVEKTVERAARAW